MTTSLFVYGTLRQPAGGPPGDTHFHHAIADGVLSAQPASLPKAQLVDFGAYPGVGPGDGVVRGEVFTIEESTLLIADQIEGHPAFYERRQETVVLDSGGTAKAWVYWAPESLLSDPTNRRIESGDWFDRERSTGLPAPLALPADEQVVAGFDRLIEADYSWLSTVHPDGRPQSTPMWHLVVGNRVYFVTTTSSVKVANVAANPHVVVTHPDPQDVAIVDGWAIEAPHLLLVLAPLLLKKYDWDIAGDDFDGEWTVIEVTPQVLRMWKDQHTHRRWELGHL